MNPEDLPNPPLSPDPNSLQGKILTLLDDEHQLGEFPTQSELAKKLEKSQQLISHHLRTLQKFGLVEKRKMGIKNRYKLTKEALFLLETDMEFTKVRDYSLFLPLHDYLFSMEYYSNLLLLVD